MTFEPLEIDGVITEQVGRPRNDGTRGSALYSVPIRLFRKISPEEGRFLCDLWDRPPSFTTKHRPGIASVSGDVLILNGTTIEEVRDTHSQTLSLIVERFNEEVPRMLAEQQARDDGARAEREVHERNVADVADTVSFD